MSYRDVVFHALRTGHCSVRNGNTYFPDKPLKSSYVQIFHPTRCIKYVEYQLILICHDQEKLLSLSLRTGHTKNDEVKLPYSLLYIYLQFYS